MDTHPTTKKKKKNKKQYPRGKWKTKYCKLRISTTQGIVKWITKYYNHFRNRQRPV